MKPTYEDIRRQLSIEIFGMDPGPLKEYIQKTQRKRAMREMEEELYVINCDISSDYDYVPKKRKGSKSTSKKTMVHVELRRSQRRAGIPPEER